MMASDEAIKLDHDQNDINILLRQQFPKCKENKKIPITMDGTDLNNNKIAILFLFQDH